jgi:hypothetical protein
MTPSSPEAEHSDGGTAMITRTVRMRVLKAIDPQAFENSLIGDLLAHEARLKAQIRACGHCERKSSGKRCASGFGSTAAQRL